MTDGLWVMVTKAAAVRFEEGTILEMRYGSDDKEPPLSKGDESEKFEWRFIPNGVVSDITDPADAKQAARIEKNVKLATASKVIDPKDLAACVELCAKDGSGKPVLDKTGAIAEAR